MKKWILLVLVGFCVSPLFAQKKGNKYEKFAKEVCGLYTEEQLDITYEYGAYMMMAQTADPDEESAALNEKIKKSVEKMRGAMTDEFKSKVAEIEKKYEIELSDKSDFPEAYRDVNYSLALLKDCPKLYMVLAIIAVMEEVNPEKVSKEGKSAE